MRPPNAKGARIAIKLLNCKQKTGERKLGLYDWTRNSAQKLEREKAKWKREQGVAIPEGGRKLCSCQSRF